MKVWDKAVSRGGCDAKGIVIRSWIHYLNSEFAYERGRNGESKAVNGSVPEWKQIQFLEEAISQHKANRISDFYNNPTELEKADLRAKRKKLADLKARAIA